MKLKYKIIILIILLLVFISTVKTTYSRYVSEATSTASYTIAQWQFKLNNTDITSSTTNTFTITPTIDSSTNVASGKVAPGSTGSFKIAIDATKVDTSYNMVITATPNNTISDIKIDYYKVCTSADVCGSNQSVGTNTLTINKNNLVNNSSDSLYFGSYYIYVKFYWDDTSGTMNNTTDTNVGLNAANGTTTNATIVLSATFTQYTG